MKLLVSKLSQLTDQIAQRTNELELAMVHLGDESDVMVQADYVRDEILPRWAACGRQLMRPRP